jgi:hypothetical protein
MVSMKRGGLTVQKKKRKKRVSTTMSKGQRQDLEAKMNLDPALSAVSLIRQNRGVKCLTPSEAEEDNPAHAITDLLEALKGKVKDVQRRDMSGMEGMLVSQAHALDALFQSLAGKAMRQAGLRQLEGIMKIALRTQSQCRATIETLSNVKNPRQAVLLARQANIAEVQQVNNGPAPVITPAGKDEITPNKVLEVPCGKKRLVAGTPAADEQDDTHLEAVGEIHRAAHAGR